MLESTGQFLERNTQAYWRISRIKTGRSKERISTESAIREVNEITWRLGSHRALRKQAQSLSDAIIEGSKPKKKIPATIIVLKKTASTNA